MDWWSGKWFTCLLVSLAGGFSGIIGVVNAAGAATPDETRLFLTVKSGSVGSLSLPDVTSAFVVVTDLLVSPGGQPLPFLNRELDRSYFKGLQITKPDVKFLASFGGTATPPELFAHLALGHKRRAGFVQNLVRFAKTYGFGGIDIAWLYPTQTGRDGYISLLRELREVCDRQGLILTVTVPSNPSVIDKNYPVKELQQYVHYVILSANEFRKLKKTSLIAPLYSLTTGSTNSLDYHVTAWKLAGLDATKIVISIQTNSLTYKLLQPNEYHLGTPVAKLKVRPFYKICQKLYAGSLEIFEENTRCPYAFRDLNWYSYENRQSIAEKVEYAIGQSLGGISVLSFDEDDPGNVCGDGAHPMTTTILSTLKSLENNPKLHSRSIVAQPIVLDIDSYEEYSNVRMVDEDVPYSAAPIVCNEDDVLYVQTGVNDGSTYVTQQVLGGSCGTCGSDSVQPTVDVVYETQPQQGLIISAQPYQMVQPPQQIVQPVIQPTLTATPAPVVPCGCQQQQQQPQQQQQQPQQQQQQPQQSQGCGDNAAVYYQPVQYVQQQLPVQVVQPAQTIVIPPAVGCLQCAGTGYATTTAAPPAAACNCQQGGYSYTYSYADNNAQPVQYVQQIVVEDNGDYCGDDQYTTTTPCPPSTPPCAPPTPPCPPPTPPCASQPCPTIILANSDQTLAQQDPSLANLFGALPAGGSGSQLFSEGSMAFGGIGSGTVGSGNMGFVGTGPGGVASGGTGFGGVGSGGINSGGIGSGSTGFGGIGSGGAGSGGVNSGGIGSGGTGTGGTGPGGTNSGNVGSGDAGSGSSSPDKTLFSEPKPVRVPKPPPKDAEFDPKSSRIGVIATGKVQPSPNSTCGQANNLANFLNSLGGNGSPLGGGNGSPFGGGNGSPFGNSNGSPFGNSNQQSPIVSFGGAGFPSIASNGQQTPGGVPSINLLGNSGPMISIAGSASFVTTPAPAQAVADFVSNMQNLASILPQLTCGCQNPPSPAGPTFGASFNICPYDGIIPDPRNPRFYYLCRRGLPMCDENRFSCADGYVFDASSQKCVQSGGGC